MYLSVHPTAIQTAFFFTQIASQLQKFSSILKTHKNIIHRQTDLDHLFDYKIIVSHAINR